MKNVQITVTIDLGRIRRSAEEIRRRIGTAVLAVVKADAYGLGARQVARCLADIVDGFVVFSLFEAVDAGLREISPKPILVLGPHPDMEAEDFLATGARPSVWTVAEARRLRAAHPAVCVDTGMNRFACPPQEVDAVLAAGGCVEAFTHAVRLDQALRLKSMLADHVIRLHAAGSSLLGEPTAWLDAVRPGIALYRGAVRVSTRLLETHEGGKPAGYTGFCAQRFGVIPCGYLHGLRPGLCMIAAARQRVLEVGMQSAFVQIGPGDRPGDEVVLLGDGLTEAQVAVEWGTTEHEALLRLARMGET